MKQAKLYIFEENKDSSFNQREKESYSKEYEDIFLMDDEEPFTHIKSTNGTLIHGKSYIYRKLSTM